MVTNHTARFCPCGSLLFRCFVVSRKQVTLFLKCEDKPSWKCTSMLEFCGEYSDQCQESCGESAAADRYILPPGRQGQVSREWYNIHVPVSAAPENRLHFITACRKLCQGRQPYLIELEKPLLVSNAASNVSSALSDPHLVLQLIMDCTSPVIRDRLLWSDTEYWEMTSMKMCFALHLKRCFLLK